MEEPPEGRDATGTAMLQTAQFQLCAEVSVLEPQQDALSSCSPTALAVRGWKGPSSLPWPGRRFQHLLGIKKSHELRDQSTNPKQGFKKGLGEGRVRMGRI